MGYFLDGILFKSPIVQEKGLADASLCHHSGHYGCFRPVQNVPLRMTPTQWVQEVQKWSSFMLDSKLYIPSTLNTDSLLWHTQLIVCAVKY